MPSTFAVSSVESSSTSRSTKTTRKSRSSLSMTSERISCISVWANRCSGLGPQSASSRGMRSSSPSTGSSSENWFGRRLRSRKRFIRGDAHKPSVKAGIFLEILEVRVRLEEGILHGVLGVLAIPSNVHGQPEDFRFIAVYQLFEGMRIATLGGGHQQVFVVARNGGRQTVGIRYAQCFGQADRRPQPRFRKYKGSTEHRTVPPSSCFDAAAGDGIQEMRESYGVVGALRKIR